MMQSRLEEAESAIRPEPKQLSADQLQAVGVIKAKAIDLHVLLSGLPASREVSLAKTKLEESVMWAVKSITK